MITIKYNFMPEHLGRAASNAIPDENWPWWHRYNNNNSVKYGSVDYLRFPHACKVALNYIATNFEPPPYAFPDFDFYGAGMHMIPPNGWLSGHYDAQYHPLHNWKRVGSLVWFANQEWSNDWGGNLIIEGISITPQFNKIAYFDTDNCWHNVEKVIGPQYRKTLSIFYWEKVDCKPLDINTQANFRM